MKNGVGFYSIEELKNNSSVLMDSNLSDEEIRDLKYIADGSTVVIGYTTESDNINDYSYSSYIENSKKVIERFRVLNRKITLLLDIPSRNLISKSGILEDIPKNINLQIVNDGNRYKASRYLEEDEVLNEMIKDISDKGLSPLEMFYAIYDIVKKGKTYEKNDKTMTTTHIREIIKSDKLVCTGFSTLLCTLLDKAGIKAMPYSFAVDTSYDKGFTEETIPTNESWHARALVHLVDEKYNIDAYFTSDPTWDNKVDEEYYNCALNPYNMTEEEARLMYLNIYDVLFSSNDVNTFNKKLSFYVDFLKRSGHREDAIYNGIYKKILFTLKELDEKEYLKEFEEAGMQEFLSIPDCKEIISSFSNYIVNKTNKRIDSSTFIKSLLTMKKNTTDMSKEELEDWINNVIEKYYSRQEHLYPYDEELNENVMGRGM